MSSYQSYIRFMLSMLFMWTTYALVIQPASKEPMNLEGYRLIAFSDDNAVWMNSTQAAKVEVESDNFMDITFYPKPTPKKFAVDPIPNKIRFQTEADEYIGELEQANIQTTITALSTFFTRYYQSVTGKLAAQYLYEQCTEFAAGRDDIHILYFQHTWAMPSVIARIEGTGDIAGTRVVVGGHEDCVGSSQSGRSPGADDDASGSASVLEVFRVLAQSGFKPNRTVEFHFYSGEEGGLLGSQAIALEYYNMGIIVESMLQLDMTGYGTDGQPLGLIGDYTNPDLSNFMKLLIPAYSSLTFAAAACGYGCSDHASWTKYGYRSAFPFETTFNTRNPYIHTPNDVIEKLNLPRAFEFVKFAVGYVVEMSLL